LVDWFRIDDPRTGKPMNMATVTHDLRARKRAEAELRRVNESPELRVADKANELGAGRNRTLEQPIFSGRSKRRWEERRLQMSIKRSLKRRG
jgi:hypothetical protein